MTPDDIIDLFAEFGPVALKRAFSGYAIAADGVNFAMSLKSGIIMRVDEATAPRYEAEGAKSFSYSTSKKTVVVKSYRHLPERLYDDPEELAVWARDALEAARRAKMKKSSKGIANPGDAPRVAGGRPVKKISKKAVKKAVKKTSKASANKVAGSSTKKAALKRGRAMAKRKAR